MTWGVAETFSIPLLKWFDLYGRKDLPWQHPRSAYRVWLSEIMLQQTQVKTVIPYFNRFLTRFPTIQALAKASEDEVLSYWSGLGYYSRARLLHKTAVIISTTLHGEFPSHMEELVKLPGIGPSTAAAISSLAFAKPAAILDGNVKRVLSRYFLVSGTPDEARVKQTLWQLANECMPHERCADYTQAIMDFGATCCTSKNPNCEACPIQNTCLAKIHDEVNHYPQPKKTKKRPTKEEQFLLFYNKDHAIYLERRPSSGLWGGLWCLPSIDKDQCAKTHVVNTYPLHVISIQDLLSIKHSFSHFHLHITALAIKTRIKRSTTRELQGRWFQAHELGALGLAKPVSDIIYYFFGK